MLPCVPVIVAPSGRDTHILKLHWPDSLAKMVSFQFSEVKANLLSEGNKAIASVGKHVHAYVFTTQTHTQRDKDGDRETRGGKI